MSDTQSSMREFRMLDDRRRSTGLAPQEEQHWQHLGIALGLLDAADFPASSQPVMAEQPPQGAWGPDGLWYPYAPAPFGYGNYPQQPGYHSAPPAPAPGYTHQPQYPYAAQPYAAAPYDPANQPPYGQPPYGYAPAPQHVGYQPIQPQQAQGYYAEDGQWYSYAQVQQQQAAWDAWNQHQAAAQAQQQQWTPPAEMQPTEPLAAHPIDDFSADEIMEISDQELIEIPVTAPRPEINARPVADAPSFHIQAIEDVVPEQPTFSPPNENLQEPADAVSDQPEAVEVPATSEPVENFALESTDLLASLAEVPVLDVGAESGFASSGREAGGETSNTGAESGFASSGREAGGETSNTGAESGFATSATFVEASVPPGEINAVENFVGVEPPQLAILEEATETLLGEQSFDIEAVAPAPVDLMPEVSVFSALEMVQPETPAQTPSLVVETVSAPLLAEIERPPPSDHLTPDIITAEPSEIQPVHEVAMMNEVPPEGQHFIDEASDTPTLPKLKPIQLEVIKHVPANVEVVHFKPSRPSASRNAIQTEWAPAPAVMVPVVPLEPSLDIPLSFPISVPLTELAAVDLALTGSPIEATENAVALAPMSEGAVSLASNEVPFIDDASADIDVSVDVNEPSAELISTDEAQRIEESILASSHAPTAIPPEIVAVESDSLGWSNSEVNEISEHPTTEIPAINIDNEIEMTVDEPEPTVPVSMAQLQQRLIVAAQNSAAESALMSSRSGVERRTETPLGTQEINTTETTNASRFTSLDDINIDMNDDEAASSEPAPLAPAPMVEAASASVQTEDSFFDVLPSTEISQPVSGFAISTTASEPQPENLAVSDSNNFVPMLDDLPEVIEAPTPEVAPVGFMPSLDDLPMEEAPVEYELPVPIITAPEAPRRRSLVDMIALQAETAPPIDVTSSPSGSFPQVRLTPQPLTELEVKKRDENLVFASSWQEAVVTPNESVPDTTVDSFFGGNPDDAMPMAEAAEFVGYTPRSDAIDDFAIEASSNDFELDSSPAAVLANQNVAPFESTAHELEVADLDVSTDDVGTIELSQNADFLAMPALTQTGEAFSSNVESIALDEEEEVLQGTIVEDDEMPESQPVALFEPAQVLEPIQAVASTLQMPAFSSAPTTTTTPRIRVATPIEPQLPREAPPNVPISVPRDAFDRANVAPNAQTMPAFRVPGEHRVTLHSIEGQVKRGLLKEANLSESQVRLETATSVESIPTERVKALFFLLVPGAQAATPSGDRIRVTFRDGRQVMGFSQDYKSANIGFFVVPADNRTNTERIFVYRHAVQSVDSN